MAEDGLVNKEYRIRKVPFSYFQDKSSAKLDSARMYVLYEADTDCIAFNEEASGCDRYISLAIEYFSMNSLEKANFTSILVEEKLMPSYKNFIHALDEILMQRMENEM